jgi:hypothetical protein
MPVLSEAEGTLCKYLVIRSFGHTVMDTVMKEKLKIANFWLKKAEIGAKQRPLKRNYETNPLGGVNKGFFNWP